MALTEKLVVFQKLADECLSSKDTFFLKDILAVEDSSKTARTTGLSNSMQKTKQNKKLLLYRYFSTPAMGNENLGGGKG